MNIDSAFRNANFNEKIIAKMMKEIISNNVADNS